MRLMKQLSMILCCFTLFVFAGCGDSSSVSSSSSSVTLAKSVFSKSGASALQDSQTPAVKSAVSGSPTATYNPANGQVTIPQMQVSGDTSGATYAVEMMPQGSFFVVTGVTPVGTVALTSSMATFAPSTGLVVVPFMVVAGDTSGAQYTVSLQQQGGTLNFSVASVAPVANSTDISGDWTGYMLQAGTTEAQPGYFTLTQSGNTITGTGYGDFPVSGTITGSNFSLTFYSTGSGEFTASGVLNENSMTGTLSGQLTGAFTATKGFADSNDLTLYYGPSNNQWFISAKAYTAKNPRRVYLTGPYITGQYDLFKCSTYTGQSSTLQWWWSSNNAACTEGGNNASLTSAPILPFDVTLHVVTSSGEVTYTKTITSYKTL